MLKFNDQKFFAVDDKGGSNSVDLDSKKVDTYDALGGDDDEIIKLDEESGKGKTEEKEIDLKKDKETEEIAENEEEINELAEIEEELAEPDEEKLELTTPVRRREILAKYPKLFKDFPYLEKAYYREQQFTELFPTIEDARAAQDAQTTLKNFEQDLMNGKTEGILNAIKEEDKNSFYKIVDNYLIALYNVDQMAYYHVLGNIGKQTIASMVTEGKKMQNDALVSAAVVLNQYLFSKGDWEPPTNLAREEKEKDSVSEDRKKFNEERLKVASDDLQQRIDNSLKATIEQNIDRNEAMTEYVRKNACREAFEKLESLIDGDSRFQSLKDKLWQKAAEENYSKASIDRIKSAFVTKAKTLLPAVIKQARNEALRGLGKKVKDDTEDVNDGSTRTQQPRKTTSSSSSGNAEKDKARQIPKGMTTYEYLNS